MEEIQKEERPLEFDYNREDAKLLKDNRITILASILFIAMAIIVGVLITKKLEMRDQVVIDVINREKPTHAISPTHEEWKTYANSDLGITFKYPSDTTIKPTFDENSGKVFHVELWNEIFGPFISFSYIENPDNLSLAQLDDKIHEEEHRAGYGIESPNLFQPDSEDKVINDLTAIYQKEFFCEPSICQRYIINKNERVYQIIIFPRVEAENEVNQILSTFKFTETE